MSTAASLFADLALRPGAAVLLRARIVRVEGRAVKVEILDSDGRPHPWHPRVVVREEQCVEAEVSP